MPAKANPERLRMIQLGRLPIRLFWEDEEIPHTKEPLKFKVADREEYSRRREEVLQVGRVERAYRALHHHGPDVQRMGSWRSARSIATR